MLPIEGSLALLPLVGAQGKANSKRSKPFPAGRLARASRGEPLTVKGIDPKQEDPCDHISNLS